MTGKELSHIAVLTHTMFYCPNKAAWRQLMKKWKNATKNDTFTKSYFAALNIVNNLGNKNLTKIQLAKESKVLKLKTSEAARSVGVALSFTYNQYKRCN